MKKFPTMDSGEITHEVKQALGVQLCEKTADCGNRPLATS
jgi:hypothetical protein